MTIKLKICGMRDPVNIAEASVLQPDYMGFIFYDQSPRYVGGDFRIPVVPASMKRVGVFVNEKTDRILNRVSQYTLDFVQLHGNESPEQCRELQHKGVKIIKAFPVDRDFDFKSVDAYSDFVSYFLFDTKGRYFGGNSTPFEWTLLERYHQSVPFFLSGGISTQNISAIKKINNPNFYALDVNSGVEFSPGVKDVNRIKELKRVLSSL